MAADWASYVGIPFVDGGQARAGADCWGLVQLVHSEQTGRCPPVVARPALDDEAAIAAELAAQGRLWAPVHDFPRPLDVALFLGDPFHVGVLTDAVHMLHVERGRTSVWEPYRASRWGNRLLGVYRYVG